MVSVLNLNKVGVARISKENEKINLVLRENAYKDFENLKSNVNKSISNSGFDIEEVIVTYKRAGLVAKGYDDDNNTSEKEILYENNVQPSLNYSPSLILRPFLRKRGFH